METNMETDSELLAETPDIDFSENFAEQETPDINFSEINTVDTPDIDFNEDFAAAGNQSRERLAIDDNDDIDDLDEPDQYVEREDGDDDDDVADDTNQESSNTNQETGSIDASKCQMQNSISQIKHCHCFLLAASNKNKANSKPKDTSDNRLVQLPIARVKHIMKVDPDVSLITGECSYLVSKATELFIESLAREAYLHTAQAKKKTVQKRDVDAAIENVESLIFLEGMMNF